MDWLQVIGAGALVGLVLTGIARLGILIDQRHRERAAVMSALRAEMHSVLLYIEMRGYEDVFSRWLVALDQHIPITLGRQPGAQPLRLQTPVYSAHVGRLGHLPTKIAYYVAAFHTALDGLQIDHVDMLSGVFDHDPDLQKAVLESDLVLLNTCKSTLKKVANYQRFWGWFGAGRICLWIVALLVGGYYLAM